MIKINNVPIRMLHGKGHDWPTFVYLMEGDYGNKFGITNSTVRRTRQYLKTNPELSLVFHKLFDSKNLARWVEYNMKRHFEIVSGLETTFQPKWK